MARKYQGNTDEHRYFNGVESYISEHGEPRISAPAATHKVVPIAQAEAFKRKLAQRERSAEFTFTDMDNISEIIARIPDKHCGYLLFLQTFVDYDDGVIRCPNNRPMTTEDVMKALDIRKTAFYEFIREMKSAEIITETSGVYRLNTKYHFRGKSDNRNVIKAFSAKVRALYNETNAKDLGLIYKVLPFVHYETNTICINPYENDVERIEPITKARMADICEMTEKSVYTKLRRLRFGDQYAFAQVIHGNKTFYKINPFVFYRKDGAPDATLREIFSIDASYRAKRVH